MTLALSACSSSTTGDTDAQASSSPPAASASQSQSPTADAGEETFTHSGVTVTGARDQEPTITLAEDFGPVTDLDVADVYEGSGDAVAADAILTVNYVGVGQQSREVFDSSWPTGQPVTFPLSGVITGWEEGMIGMKPGGRRLLIIPGSMAYGDEGSPSAGIGQDETLVFVVDLVSQTPAA